MTVYDCQAHWYPPAFFEFCLDRHAFPRCRASDDGYLFELGRETYVPFAGPLIDLDELMALMQRSGIDVLVASSEPVGVTSWPVDQAAQGARLLNTEKARAQERYPGRFVGLATLPLQDPAGAIDELDHAIGTLGLGGVCFPSNIQGQPITTPKLMPLYERVQELNVPLFLHPTDSIASDRLRDYGLEYMLGFMLDTSVAALNLVFSGTLERYPRLKIVHPHLGAVLPYLAGRIDLEYRMPWCGNSPLPAAPSSYLRRFYTDSVSETPGSLRMALEFYGVDRVLFGTDSPWWPPGRALDFVGAVLDEEEYEKVVTTNPKVLLGA
jgi:aminocarboxymuconate-semialdehyde decarboxylase